METHNVCTNRNIEYDTILTLLDTMEKMNAEYLDYQKYLLIAPLPDYSHLTIEEQMGKYKNRVFQYLLYIGVYDKLRIQCLRILLKLNGANIKENTHDIKSVTPKKLSIFSDVINDENIQWCDIKDCDINSIDDLEYLSIIPLPDYSHLTTEDQLIKYKRYIMYCLKCMEVCDRLRVQCLDIMVNLCKNT